MFKEIAANLLSSPVVWGVLFTALIVLVSLIIHKTKAKKDDKIWHGILGMATHAFNLAEKIIPDKSQGFIGKLDKALKIFNEEYQKRNGKAPDEDLIGFVKDEFAIMAHELKKK